MVLNRTIESAVSTDAKVKVLNLLLKRGFSATGREMGRLCGISQTMAIKILKEFENMKIARSMSAGKSVLWSGDESSFAYEKAQKLLEYRNDFVPFEHLKKMLKKEFNLPWIIKAVIFGSVAEKKEKYSSDIDVFLCLTSNIYRKKAEEICNELSIKCLKLYGNPLRAYILTEHEMDSPANRTLINNIHRGVILYDKKGERKER